MIKLENWEVVGWEHAIRGMRNPMNSWAKMDSTFKCNDIACEECPQYVNRTTVEAYDDFDVFKCDAFAAVVGPNDHDLMMRLAKGGPVHAKYRRMITVYVDITAPLYWWKEFDTYKVGTVANSCSTMHKIHAKEFTLEDFSCEKLLDEPVYLHDGLDSKEVRILPMAFMINTIDALNIFRKKYLETKNKNYWWQMIQLLPTSYNQKRTVMLNYEVLHNIYYSRKNHKLDEWHVLCDWIKSLPYSEVICCEEEEKNV